MKLHRSFTKVAAKIKVLLSFDEVISLSRIERISQSILRLETFKKSTYPGAFVGAHGWSFSEDAPTTPAINHNYQASTTGYET